MGRQSSCQLLKKSNQGKKASVVIFLLIDVINGQYNSTLHSK